MVFVAFWRRLRRVERRHPLRCPRWACKPGQIFLGDEPLNARFRGIGKMRNVAVGGRGRAGACIFPLRSACIGACRWASLWWELNPGPHPPPITKGTDFLCPPFSFPEGPVSAGLRVFSCGRDGGLVHALHHRKVGSQPKSRDCRDEIWSKNGFDSICL